MRRLAPIAGFFMLAVPIWATIAPPLQWLTIAVNGVALRLLGVPAVLDGDVVHLEHGSFLIAEGCAGVNYLTSGLTIGYLCGQAFDIPRNRRATVAALAVGIAILANWVRVTSLIVIGWVSEMQSGVVTQSNRHVFYGWAIFAAAMVLFLWLASRMVGSSPRRASRVDAGTARAADPSSPPRTGGPIRPAALASAVVLVGPLLYYSIGALPAREIPEARVGGGQSQWTARPDSSARPYAWRPAFVGADEYVSTSWTDGSERLVVDQVLYRDQAQGREVVGYTSKVAPVNAVLRERSIPGVGLRPRVLREAIVADGDSAVLIWYWYRVGGVETGSPAIAKLLEVVAFFRRVGSAEVIAVSAQCTVDDCTRAARSLISFLEAPPRRSGA